MSEHHKETPLKTAGSEGGGIYNNRLQPGEVDAIVAEEIGGVSPVTCDTAKLVSGIGQTHTDEPGKEHRRPYLSITLAEIRAMVDNPPKAVKGEGRWFIPSTLHCRVFAEQRQHGEYWWLWADLDKDPKPLAEVDEAVLYLLGMRDYEVHASSSARLDYQKGRVLIPLAVPLSGVDWLTCQTVLNDKLEAAGFKPDRASERAAQLCYLPAEGEFYTSYSMRNGEYFNPLEAWGGEIEAARQQVTSKGGKGLSKPRKREDISDPVVDFLLNEWTVYNIAQEGRVDLLCPWDGEHTTDTGESSTSYYPAGVGGFDRGHFKCYHSHCTHRTDRDFLEKIGYLTHGFEVLPDPTPEEEAEQEAIRSRNELKALRLAKQAIDRAKFKDRSAMEEERRRYQKEENERIGQGEHTIPPAEVISLETALNRFVFLADGSRVADIFNPHYDLAVSDWRSTYAASKEAFPQPGKPDKEIPVTRLWLESPRRKSVVSRTFKAGGALVLNDPAGRRALNSWKPFDRSLEVDDLQAAGLGLFLDHVDFLFGADTGRFLDWLAHIEQFPGELPHTAWLHIAKNFGMGRNWLASVLTRVWAGYVAANLDLVAMMKDGFNGRLSGKILATIDEIREGGRDTHWEHSEKMKSLITEEHRTVNPKYGRQSIEFNACRFLMFSQHLSALPMERGDRRIEVVHTAAEPKPASYYARLYSALNDPRFIASVAAYLGQRDISDFNPGAHATNSDAKQAATEASQTPMAKQCELLVKHWPSDLIRPVDLLSVLEEVGLEAAGKIKLTAAHRRTLEQFGIASRKEQIKIGETKQRVWYVRNRGQWEKAGNGLLVAEFQKAFPDGRPMDACCYLADLIDESHASN